MRAHAGLALALSLPLLSAACGELPMPAIPPAEPDAAPDPDAGGYVPPAAAPDAGLAMDAAAGASPPPIASARLGRNPAVCRGGGAPQAYLLTTAATLLAFDPTTLSTRALGTLACPTTLSPRGFAVSVDGKAYVEIEDGTIDEVDLSTLACTATAYSPGQLALDGVRAFGAGAGPSAGRLYYSAQVGSEFVLAFSDVEGFSLFEAGSTGAASALLPIDLKFDASDRMFALADDGTLLQLDPATGAVIGADRTGFDASVGGSGLLAWQDELLFFQGGSGNVSRYDVVTKSLTPLGAIGATLAGVGAAPCVSADVASAGAGGRAQDGGGDAGPAEPSPLAPGQAWIGTYACSEGVTSAALVIDSISDGAIVGRVDLRVGNPPSAASYAVTGTYDPASRKATFAPGGFIGSQPYGVNPVGLDGFVTLSGHELSGTVAFAGCGAFSMRR